MKTLPIGISTFSEIRSENCYYVDKSVYVHQLAAGGKYYFLSRPRRFGKTLFVDTLKCAFEGRRELFEGLYLENHWNWDETYPVVSISLTGARFFDLRHLEDTLEEILILNARRLGLEINGITINGRFKNLMIDAAEKFGRRVVILVDEYDKPILDNLDDVPKAEALRDGLKNFYAVIKDSDAYIKFCFITGVSKFSRVSIFSDLNNLKDITLDPRVGAICGYTQRELEDTFADRLSGIDPEQLRIWYNGYNFLGKEKVYNPFDVLLFLDHGVFGNYWFESATPSFLIKWLRHRQTYLPDLEHIEIDQDLLGGFELDGLLPEAVLFQSGYLTIRKVQELAPGQYILALDFPNQEVRVSLNKHLLDDLTGRSSSTGLGRLRLNMAGALREGEPKQIRHILQALFSSIPYEWYTQNDMDRYEGYYASVVYAFLASLGFDLRPEQSGSHGRADLIVDVGALVYVIEFKVVELTGDGKKAIDQIREKGYHHQYVRAGRDVMLIGMDFSRQERNLVGFGYERL
jgi:hypothetical protein